MPRLTLSTCLALLTLFSTSGCAFVGDEYGTCDPAPSSDLPPTRIRPVASFPSPINPDTAIVCHPEGALSVSETTQAGLATSADGSPQVATLQTPNGGYRTTACIDVDFCLLAAHGAVWYVAKTVFGSRACMDTSWMISDCTGCPSGLASEGRCNNSDDADAEPCVLDDVPTADDLYVFISTNGRDFEHLDSVDLDSRTRTGEKRVDTGNSPFRFVRFCRPDRSSGGANVRISSVSVGTRSS